MWLSSDTELTNKQKAPEAKSIVTYLYWLFYEWMWVLLHLDFLQVRDRLIDTPMHVAPRESGTTINTMTRPTLRVMVRTRLS